MSDLGRLSILDPDWKPGCTLLVPGHSDFDRLELTEAGRVYQQLDGAGLARDTTDQTASFESQAQPS
jgi:hypothetical protein